jgi:nitrogen fixation NifU-like protein
MDAAPPGLRLGKRAVLYALYPEHMGEIPGANGSAKITGRCEDTVEIFINVRDGIILDISFLTDGCSSSVAAVNAACELVKGKSVHAALALKPETIVDFLGGLPDTDAHCANLAADTVRAAVRDYMSTVNEPWRRLYRKP